MTLFWIIAGAMAFVAFASLLWPLLRGNPVNLGEREAAISVLRDQLRELERDREAGRIGEEEARAARVEIERRALAADRLSSEGENGRDGGWRTGLVAAAAVAVPVLAFLLYLDIGSLQLASRMPGEVAVERAGGEQIPGDMAARTDELAQRLAAEGGSFEDWWLLGQSYVFMQQPAKAAEALARASELNPDPAVKSARAEMLIQANGGRVTAEAERLFGEVLAADPNDPRARYYKGLAAAQAQFFDDALTIWQELLADTPDDAPWLNAVTQGITDVASAMGRDPGPLLAGRGSSQPVDLATLRERLAAQPKDYEGWLALAQGELAAGDIDAARAAIAEVKSIYDGAPFVQQQIARAERAMGLTSERRGPSQEDVAAAQDMSADEQLEMIRGMVGGLAERLDSSPDDKEGWLMLLRSYGVLGEREAGRAAFDRAIAHFADDQTFRSVLQQQAESAGILP